MKKVFKCILASSIASTLIVSLSFANESINQNDINNQNSMSKAKVTKPQESMRDFFRRVATDFGFNTYGAKKNGTMFFFKGEAIVSLQPSDPDFGRAIVNAYEQAILDLQSNYIVDTFGTLSSDRVSSLYNDTSTNAKKFEDNLGNETKVNGIMDKTLDFIDAKLDKGLKELGRDPKKLTKKQKKTLFKKELIKSVVTKAYGNMAGLTPIKTHITFDKKGNYSVGVVAVISAKTQQIAKDMALLRKSKIKGNGKDINSFLPQNEKGFLNELGIRLVYDSQGKPTIISYGRWSYNEDSNDAYINKMASKTALEQAKVLADASIVEFMNTKLSFKSDSQTGEISERVATREIDNETNAEMLDEKVIKNIVSKVSKEIRARANGKIRGITTFTDWEATDSYGINHVGVVRVWNYDNVEAVNNMLKVKKNKPSQSKTKTTQSTKTYESKPVNSLNDF